MEKQKLNKSKKTLTGQPKDEINIRPKERIQEAASRSVVLTFGRMNPPTVGHQMLVDKIIKTARAKKATPLIYLSHSSDPKKNPLSYDEKLRLAQAAFGRNVVVKSPARTIIEILKSLQSQFDNVTMVVGSDRVPEFKRILNTYNGDVFKFKSVEVISAGTRDPDAEGVSGMSASKMRELASNNNITGFRKGLPHQISHMADMVMQMVRAGMKLQEELEREGLHLDEAVLSIAQRRKKALLMRKYKTRLKVGRERQARRMASGARLTKRSRRAAVKLLRRRLAGKKGQKYTSLSSAEKMVIDKRVQQRTKLIGKLAKRLMPAVRRAEVKRLTSESFDRKFESYLQETEQYFNFNSLQEVTVVVDKFLEHLERNNTIIEDKAMKNIIRKSEQTGISQNELIEAYREGYNNPRGNQTAEQSAFIALNKYISEKEVWDKPMPEKAKKGSLSPSQKAKAKARAKSAGRPYPNMVDNMWASKQEQVNHTFEESISFDTGGPASSGDTVQRLLHKKLKQSGRDDLAKEVERHNPQLKKKTTEEIERTADVKRVKVKTADGKYAWRNIKREVKVESVNERFEAAIDEKMNMKKADMGDVVKDFYKSDAPQFKGKSKAKRRQMAIAAKLSAEEHGAGEEGTNELVRNYKKDTPGQ